jgi:hypothetical protein
LPIQKNIVFVREDGENDGEKLGAFFTSTSASHSVTPSSRHPVIPHELVFHIGEAVEPTISLDIVFHVFKFRGPDIQNGFITHKHFDEEIAILHKI